MAIRKFGNIHGGPVLRGLIVTEAMGLVPSLTAGSSCQHNYFHAHLLKVSSDSVTNVQIEREPIDSIAEKGSAVK